MVERFDKDGETIMFALLKANYHTDKELMERIKARLRATMPRKREKTPDDAKEPE